MWLLRPVSDVSKVFAKVELDVVAAAPADILLAGASRVKVTTMSNTCPSD